MPAECPFEAEVLAAVLECRWPERADPELRCHAGMCRVCADTALLSTALREDREQLRAAAVLPESGRVWWMAQLRARREAERAAARPITVAQVLAACAGAGFAGACFGATSDWFRSQLGLLARTDAAGFAAFFGSATGLIVAAGLVAMLILIPAALWLAVGRD